MVLPPVAAAVVLVGFAPVADFRRLAVGWRQLRLDWLALIGGRLGEQLVEVSGEVALEASQRTLGGLAFGLFAGEVPLGRRIALGTGDGDDVQRVVELAVAVPVEAVLGAPAGGARDRRGPGLLRESSLRAEALGAGGVADQDRGYQRAAALLGQQLGAVRGDELGQLAM